MVMVNACGWHHEGGPSMDYLVESAAEWVRYANKVRNYRVSYWEIGNEVEGPFGGNIDQYITTYLRFRTAMQEIDPTVKIGFGAHTDKKWFEAIVKRHPNKVDFLVAHPYMNDSATHGDYLAHDGSTLLVKRVEDAVNAIRMHGGSHREGIAVLVTEASSFSFRRGWQNGENNMTKALAWFEMAGNMLCMPEVRYIHFWTGHSPWSGRQNRSMDKALMWDNEVLPMGFVNGLLANHFRDNMVECTRVAGPIRAYASHGSGGMTVWLANKDVATRPVRLRVPSESIDRSAESLMCFRGKSGSPDDLEYTWTELSAWSEQKDGLQIDLPSCSITVVQFEESRCVLSAGGV